ncbi:RNA polymerase sigma factor SigE [Streptomyces virginiae]|uniref:RNA polymerase sigma factor SigE n=1 Tax=Streptomyces virginiae TaxID=1961 RepID=UPI00099D8C36|nr:RNA polymerase sigma factor SigE [Streptomyces virginiae]
MSRACTAAAKEAEPDSTRPGTATGRRNTGHNLQLERIYPIPSWDEIVRAHSQQIFRLAFQLSGNRYDAEDLTQDVFIRVFHSLPQYRPGTMGGWIHRITVNIFLDMVRRRSRIRFEYLTDSTDSLLPGSERNPAQAYHEEQLDPDIEIALEGLPEDFRTAIILCDIEGFTYEEVAQFLDIKLGTVRSRIHRGRARLRVALAHRASKPSTGPGWGYSCESETRSDG